MHGNGLAEMIKSRKNDVASKREGVDDKISPTKIKIAIIGLGYVGLPLLMEFSKKFQVIGFDNNSKKIEKFKAGIDVTGELPDHLLSKMVEIPMTTNKEKIKDFNVFIITVPTPVDDSKIPDMSYLKSASETVGGVLKAGDYVVYESTVYPGATEEFCVPILENFSKLKGFCTNNENHEHGFYVGYSPERINPGDINRRLTDIVKVTSGCTEYAAEFIDKLYASIIPAGTFKASSIKVAEAAKVIENTQRDVNIALINELAMLFSKLHLDTDEILNAASTKWNFLNFKPGLVGGHCIGVDPYYLTYKAKEIGFETELIQAGRNLNDKMSEYVKDQFLSLLNSKIKNGLELRVLLLGITFKENCPDVRNSKNLELGFQLIKSGLNVDFFDPLIETDSIDNKVSENLISWPENAKYDGILIAVPHQEFLDMGISKIKEFGKPGCFIFDVKSIFPKNEVDARL